MWKKKKKKSTVEHVSTDQCAVEGNSRAVCLLQGVVSVRTKAPNSSFYVRLHNNRVPYPDKREVVV